MNKKESNFLRKAGISKKEYIKRQKFTEFKRNNFKRLVKISDIPNIKNGQVLGFIYTDPDYEYEIPSYGKGKVHIADATKAPTNNEWNIDGFPFDMNLFDVKNNLNNPNFELFEINNNDHLWSLYLIKENKK
jgi:hypothetical protein